MHDNEGAPVKRLTVLVAVLIVSLLPAVPAGAARGTAADFVRDCNSDGLVRITGIQKYIGGSGNLTRICNVGMAPGSRLVFDGVELGGVGLAAISARRDTTVKVLDSVIKMDGPLELTAGCCAGDPLVAEQDGTVIVKNSTLAGEALQLLASFESPRGRVVVRESVLVSSGVFALQIRTGRTGTTKVLDTTLESGNGIQIVSGNRGLTAARRNVFDAAGAVTITTGSRGTCRATGNTPPIPCS